MESNAPNNTVNVNQWAKDNAPRPYQEQQASVPYSPPPRPNLGPTQRPSQNLAAWSPSDTAQAAVMGGLAYAAISRGGDTAEGVNWFFRLLGWMFVAFLVYLVVSGLMQDVCDPGHSEYQYNCHTVDADGFPGGPTNGDLRPHLRP